MAADDTLVIFTPQSGSPPTTRSAQHDTISDNSTPVNSIPVLAFYDQATNTEMMDFGAVMPGQYDGTSSLEVVIWWCQPSTTNANVKWDVAFKSFTDDIDILTTNSFAAIQTVTGSGSTTAYETFADVITFTNAQADSVAPNEYFVLRLERDSADAADTYTAQDIYVLAVEVRLA